MHEVVAVDIGGTHARFAIASIAADGAITLGEPETLHTADHASFQTAWEAFRTRMGGTLPAAVSMAIAGPVGSPGNLNPVIRFTNNPWIIRPPLIPEKLDVERFTIVNDFAAVAHAVARADDSQFLHLAGPDEPLGRDGTISVIGPGTGLGVAHLWRSGSAYRVQATEGGHIDFAPLDSIEDAILAFHSEGMKVAITELDIDVGKRRTDGADVGRLEGLRIRTAQDDIEDAVGRQAELGGGLRLGGIAEIAVTFVSRRELKIEPLLHRH